MRKQASLVGLSDLAVLGPIYPDVARFGSASLAWFGFCMPISYEVVSL